MCIQKPPFYKHMH